MPKLYDVITVPDPVLKSRAHEVQTIDEEIKAQMQAMKATMAEYSGIGLAANQVGKLNRIIVCNVPDGAWAYGREEDGVTRIETQSPEYAGTPVVMANPEIVWSSESRSVYEEGCLSIPGQFADIVRPAHVRVAYIDENGKSCEIEGEGLKAHCLQHEIDHLNGVLFYDYLSSLKRNMMIKKVRKAHS
jgi:peptide deformylase